MIYFLKFWAAWLLPPGFFILLFTALGAYLWWRGEKCAAKGLLVLTAAFYVLCTPLFSDRLLGAFEQQYQIPENIEGDVIVMLGGGATVATPDINGEGNLSGAAASRLLMAARLQKRLDVPILLCGGQVYSDSGQEAHIAQRLLLDLGVPENKLLLEDQSLNTKQNAQYAAKILRENGLTSPVLVTSAFHMPRSVLNFTKVGFDVTPVPTDYMVSGRQNFYFNRIAPSSSAFFNSVTVIRELLAIFVAKYIG